jgi:hypothetical protein
MHAQRLYVALEQCYGVELAIELSEVDVRIYRCVLCYLALVDQLGFVFGK